MSPKGGCHHEMDSWLNIQGSEYLKNNQKCHGLPGAEVSPQSLKASSSGGTSVLDIMSQCLLGPKPQGNDFPTDRSSCISQTPICLEVD
jgi:hypothetical protein